MQWRVRRSCWVVGGRLERRLPPSEGAGGVALAARAVEVASESWEIREVRRVRVEGIAVGGAMVGVLPGVMNLHRCVGQWDGDWGRKVNCSRTRKDLRANCGSEGM